MCDGRVFGPQLAELRMRIGTIVPSVPTADTVEQMALDLLDALPECFFLAGHSMGGIVAMEMYRVAASRICGLALISTNHRAESSDINELRQQRIARVNNGQLVAVMRDEMKPAYLADTPHKSAILDLIMKMAVELGPKVFARQSEAIRHRQDYSHVLKNLYLPVALIFGTEDRLCPPAYHSAMHHILPNSSLQAVPGAGHIPMLEQPASFCHHLFEWLETNS